MAKIKIGIADDHEAVARGVAEELETSGDFEVVFITSENPKIMSKIEDHEPDVLIMDVVMPGTISIDSFKEVNSFYPELKVIAYTALSSPVIVEMLFRAGVKGYVSKNQPLSDIKNAVMDVYYDRYAIAADYKFILQKLKNATTNEELSKREIEILQLIASEKKTTEISELLNISVNTVETHRRHLFDKLNVSNLAGLIKTAMDLGYIQ